MDHSFEQKYHKAGSSDWWIKSRRNIVLQIVKGFGIKKTAEILDIGCADGLLIEQLSNEGFSNIHGIDVSETGISQCKKRGLKNVALMDGSKTSFEDNMFDVIIASDVLEHIEDENQALMEWYRLLKPKGQLIVFVPAYKFLWSSHDEVAHHFRRYSKANLKKGIELVNFDIDYMSHWNVLLFFPITLVRILQRFMKKKGEAKSQLYFLHPILNSILLGLLNLENFFLKYIKSPFGVSIFAVCRK